MIRTARPGPGNGCRQTISAGRPSSRPTWRTSSLNSARSGSTSSNAEVRGQPADVVVRLDAGRAGAAAGLHHVGVERALDQEADRVSPWLPAARPAISRAACSNARMNSRPMILRFCSGSVTPASAATKLAGRVDHLQVDPGGRHEVLLDLLGLALRAAGRGRRRRRSAGTRSRAARGRRRPRSRPRRTARRSPGRSRPARGSRSICSSTMLRMVQVGRQPAAARNWRSTCQAVLGVQRPRDGTARRTAPGPGPRRRPPAWPRVRAVTVKPGGAAAQVSPCDIQTCCAGRQAGRAARRRAGPS